MGIVFLNIILVLFFVLMNAFFVVAEFSMVRIRKSQVNMLAANGNTAARYAKAISDDVNSYLSACQLGITIASLALGWIGEPAVAKMIHPVFVIFGLPEATIHAAAVAIGFAVITTLHIVLGELVPKSLAILSTEKYALFSAIPLFYFYRLTYPIMWLFNSITNGLLKLVGHSMAEESEVHSDEEIKLLMDESHRSGLMDEEKYEYVDNIFDLEDKDAESIMTPRPEIICLYMEDDLATHLKTVVETKFTRYPVCIEDKDHIIGFIHIKDLYSLKDGNDFKSIIRDILVIHESTSVSKLLKLFRSANTKIAVVVDEHGGTSGIATLSAAIAEIVGDIEDEYDHGEDEVEWQVLGDNHYSMAGNTSLELLCENTGLELPDDIESETVSGFILELFDEFPKVGDHIDYENFSFTVKEIEDNKKITHIDLIVTPKIDEDDEK